MTFFLFDALEDVGLLVAFNRDEAFERATRAVHFWEDKPHILGGRDEVAGGTWLCFSASGRVAWLTNYWEVGGRWVGRSQEERPVRRQRSPVLQLWF